jgi:hypothetical protein
MILPQSEASQHENIYKTSESGFSKPGPKNAEAKMQNASSEPIINNDVLKHGAHA